MLGQMGETRRATSSRKPAVVPGLNSGLLFTPKGTLILATGEWTVVTRLKSHGLRHQATKIEGYFNQIDRAVAGLPEFEVDKSETGKGTERNEISNSTRNFREQEVQRRRKIKQNVIKMWQRERMWMRHELFITEKEMKELQTKLKLSRKTRGLLPFMGDALKWVFGTATESDTKKLHKQIKEVSVGTGRLHHMIELQTTIIGSLRKGQKTNEVNIQTLANETQKIFRSVFWRQTSAVWQRLTTDMHLRQELDFSRTISSAIRTVGAAVTTHKQEVHRLKEALAHTQKGEVTTAILPPKTLETCWRTLKRSCLRDGCTQV